MFFLKNISARGITLMSLVLIITTFEGFNSPVKYVATLGILLFLALEVGNFYTNAIAVTSLFIFNVFVLFFTLINVPGWNSLIIFLGYFTCFLIFILSSNNKFEYIFDSLINYLKMIGVAFCIINVMSIVDSNSFVGLKGQFRGLVDNPNKLAGICIFFISVYLPCIANRSASRIYYLTTLMFIFLVLLTGSRGGLVCIVFLAIISDFDFKKKIIYVGFSTLMISIYMLFKNFLSGTIGVDIGNRELMEDTGRIRIFYELITKISDNYFIIGTGLSESGGRIKRELAYFDMWSFSGIGFYFWVIFAVITMYCMIKTRMHVNSEGFQVARMLFLYALFASLFEGYVSNVVSIVTIYFYISSAVIWVYYNKVRRSK